MKQYNNWPDKLCSGQNLL